MERLQQDMDLKAQELMEETDTDSRTRVYSGPMQTVITVILVGFTCFELWDSLTENFPALRAADPELACEDLAGVPLHPGVEKYYREIGLIE